MKKITHRLLVICIGRINRLNFPFFFASRYLKLFTFCLLATVSAPSYAAKDIPEVTIEYSELVDELCAFVKGYDIEEEWKRELTDKINKLEENWRKNGTFLLASTRKLVGKDFKRDKIKARLTLCNTASRAVPLIVNMRYALSSFTSTPVSMAVKTGTLYHEILHGYVNDNAPKHSALLDKYQNESLGVKEHLHLFALMKSVYDDFDLKTDLEAIIAADNLLPNGDYKRAWQIVNSDSDIGLLFVRELSR